MQEKIMSDAHYFYIAKSKTYDRIKIGISKFPDFRIYQLKEASVDDTLEFYYVSEKNEKAFLIESIWKKLLKQFKIKGEWFKVTPEFAKENLNQALEIYKNGKADEFLKSNKSYPYKRIGLAFSNEDKNLILNIRRVIEFTSQKRYSIAEIIRMALKNLANKHNVS